MNAAGMNKGNVHHHVNTMGIGNYGGRQAKMNQLRSSLVQITFHSIYGLQYELVRQVHGGEISFCKDVDAYNNNIIIITRLQGYKVNAAFMHSCENYRENAQ